MLNLVNYWKNHFYHFIVWSILYFLLVFFFIIVYTLHHELCSMCNILHPLYDAPKTNQQKNI
jgi:hypothetical protein